MVGAVVLPVNNANVRASRRIIKGTLCGFILSAGRQLREILTIV